LGRDFDNYTTIDSISIAILTSQEETLIRMGSAPTSWKVNVSVMVSTSSLSFIALTIVAIMVARSRIKASDGSVSRSLIHSPYHRIVFGLCISNLLLSLSLLTGPLSTPKSVPQAFWSIGSDLTCKMNGIGVNLGVISTPLYTLFVAYYCLCKVKSSMTDAEFSSRIEWKLHTLIVIANLAACFAVLFTKSLNSNASGSFCTIAAVPAGCRQRPQIFGECEEPVAKYSAILNFVIFIGMSLSCLTGITICMMKICWYAMVTKNSVFQESSNSCFRKSWPSCSKTAKKRSLPNTASILTNNKSSKLRSKMPKVSTNILDNSQGNSTETGKNAINAEISAKQSNADNADLEESRSISRQTPRTVETNELNSKEVLVRYYKREIIIQASLYIFAFFVTNMFTWIATFMMVIMKVTVPKIIWIFAAVCQPTFGLFMIFVYTRPKIATLRRQKNYSFVQAFIKVVEAGCVVPNDKVLNHATKPRHNELIRKKSSSVRSQPGYYESGDVMSSGGLLHNLSSIDTPPVFLADFLSSGVIGSDSTGKDDVELIERKYYKAPMKVTSQDDEQQMHNSSPESDQSLLLSSSNMQPIIEVTEEEEHSATI